MVAFDLSPELWKKVSKLADTLPAKLQEIFIDEAKHVASHVVAIPRPDAIDDFYAITCKILEDVDGVADQRRWIKKGALVAMAPYDAGHKLSHAKGGLFFTARVGRSRMVYEIVKNHAKAIFVGMRDKSYKELEAIGLNI